jgi:peptidoglycan/LPS O-acetylase OafA/YrhL
MKNQSPTFTGTGHVTQTERLYYLDWLRVFAILFVLLFHCGKIFDYHTTVVFNTVRSPVLSAFREFGFLWIMPLSSISPDSHWYVHNQSTLCLH